jgi:hypothetical protein
MTNNTGGTINATLSTSDLTPGGTYLIETARGVNVIDDATVPGHTFITDQPESDLCIPILTQEGKAVIICL